MQRFKMLLEESRQWASVNRGRELFEKAALLLQNTFDFDAGMFVYHKRFIPKGRQESTVKVYSPWGLNYDEDDLTGFISGGKWFTGSEYRVPEGWLHVSEGPPLWKKVWTEAQVEYIGAWPLKTIREEFVGAIVLGRRTFPDAEESELVSACSTYISLIFEMLTLRRIAEHASHHDSLTQILNRRGFEEQLQHFVQQNATHLVVGILDVNNFKSINDNHGHMSGDAVLQDVAEVLERNLENQGICARFGGDEFVFTLESSASDPGEVASEIVCWFAEKDYSVSVGCAKLGVDGSDWDSCFRVADRRLYSCKTTSQQE